MPEFTKAQRAALEANLTQAQLRAVETGDLRPIFQDGEFKGTVFVLDQQAAIKVGGPSDDDPPGAAPARTAADVRRDMETAQATGQQSEAIRLSRELQLIEQQGFTPAEAAKAERIERASREIAGRNQEDVDAFEDRSSVEQGPERPTEPPGADAEDKRAEEAAPREYRRQIVVYEAQKGARERLVKKYGTGFDEEGRQLVDLAEAVKSVDPAALLYAGFTQAQIDAALASNEATEQASVGYARAVAARDDLIAQYGLGVDADGRQLVSLINAVDNLPDTELRLAGFSQAAIGEARRQKAEFQQANREYIAAGQAWAKAGVYLSADFIPFETRQDFQRRRDVIVGREIPLFERELAKIAAAEQALRDRGVDPLRSGGAIGRAIIRDFLTRDLEHASEDLATLDALLASGGAFPSLNTGGLSSRVQAAGFELGRMPVLEGSKAVFILATSPVVIAGLANAAKAGLAALRGGLNRLSNVRTRQQAEAWLKDIGHQAPSGASPTATADDLVAFQRTPEWRTLTPAEQGIILQATRQAGIAGRPLAVTLAPAAPEAPPDVDVPDYEPVPLEPPADPPEIPEPFRRAFPGEDEPGIGPNPLEEPEEAPEPSPLVEPETEPREPAPTPLIEPLPEPFIPDPQREPTPRPEPAIAPAEEPETEPREPAPTPLIEPLPEPLIPDPQREPTPRPEPDIGPAPLVEPETEPREPAPTPLIEPLPEPFIPDPQREPTPRPEPAIAPAREPQTEPAPPTEPATETATEPGPITEGALGGPPFTGTAINATPEAGPGPRQAPFPFPGIGPAPADPGPFGLDEIDIVGGPGGFPGFGVPPGLPRLREPGPARTGTPYRPLIRKGKGRGAGRQVPSRPGRYPEWTGRRQGFGYKYVNHQTGEEVFSRNRAPGIPVTKGKGSARKSFRVLSRSSKKPRFPVDYMGATNAHINGGIVYKRSRKAKKRNNTRRRR